MFNSELVVIDPISFVPMVLLAHAMTVVGKMYERFCLAERILSSPWLCLLTILVEKMDAKENHRKTSRSDCGRGKKTHRWVRKRSKRLGADSKPVKGEQ